MLQLFLYMQRDYIMRKRHEDMKDNKITSLSNLSFFYKLKLETFFK